MESSPRGCQVFVLSSWETKTGWTEVEGVFDALAAAMAHAGLFGTRQWIHIDHGITRACWEAETDEKVWVIEPFIVEPLDPPRVRRPQHLAAAGRLV